MERLKAAALLLGATLVSIAGGCSLIVSTDGFLGPSADGGVGTADGNTTTADGQVSNGDTGPGSTSKTGRLFVFGGVDDDVPLPDAFVAPIREDGTLGPWENLTSLPKARKLAYATQVGSSIILIGGEEPGAYPTTSLLGTIEGNGVRWATLAGHPANRAEAGGIAVGGFFYFFGGTLMGAFRDEVFKAPVTAAGVGAWSPTTDLERGVTDMAVAATSTTLYVIGGIVNGNDPIDSITMSQIQADGTLGAFTPTASMTERRFGARAAIHKDALIVSGGFIDAPATDLVEVFPIQAGGQLGPAKRTTPLPEVRSHHSMVIFNGRIYLVGGFDEDDTNSETLIGTLADDGSVTKWEEGPRTPKQFADGTVLVVPD